MALDDAALREAAGHRGLKLVKSRRRKPGGDYGRFGLTDGTGKRLFGFDADGLTASAAEIADFLRKSEASTWAASEKATPARAKSDRPERRPPPDSEDDVRPARPKRERAARVAETATPTPAVTEPEPEPEPVPEPALRIRAARAADADALADLLALIGFTGSSRDIARAIAAASARKEAILVAERAKLVGCLAWHLVPTLQGGALARITAIVVARDARRVGIGRALYDAAAAAIGKRKIARIEAMSEIAVRNANAFYRALGMEQASYRFTGTP